MPFASFTRRLQACQPDLKAVWLQPKDTCCSLLPRATLCVRWLYGIARTVTKLVGPAWSVLRSTDMPCPARSKSSGVFNFISLEVGPSFQQTNELTASQAVDEHHQQCFHHQQEYEQHDDLDMTVGSSLIITTTSISTIVLIKLGINKSLLKQFIRCCSVTPRFVYKIYMNLHLPRLLNPSGCSPALTVHLLPSVSDIHTPATTCGNWSAPLDCVRFLLPTSAEGDFEICSSFCFVPVFGANSHGIDLRLVCPRTCA